MQAEQTYLITGASGFIGRHLCEHWLSSGIDLVALSRYPSSARQTLGERVSVVEFLTDIPEHQHIDAVVNLAGEPLFSGRWNDRRKRRFVSSRVDTTEQLVDWLESRVQRPSVLVNGSAIGYYGDQGGKVVSEYEAPHAGFAHTLCNAWEQAALQAEELGVRVCLLRTGIVLGRDGGSLQKMLPVYRLGGGGPLGKGDQWMSWIHIDDLVRLVDFLIEHRTLSGPFNGTSPQPVTNLQFSNALGRQLHRPAFVPMPAFMLRTVFGEMADELLLCSQRILPQAALDAGFEFRHVELDEALANLLD